MTRAVIGDVWPTAANPASESYQHNRRVMLERLSEIDASRPSSSPGAATST